MNERQAFALAHPLSGNQGADRALMRQLGATRRHATGLLVMSILAVDR